MKTWSTDALSALDSLLTEEERMIRDTVRRFVRERYLPRAAELFAKEQFPTDLIPEIAEMGLLGAALTGYGCAGMNSVAYGLALAGARVRRQRAAQLRQRAGLARDVADLEVRHRGAEAALAARRWPRPSSSAASA